MKKHTLDKKDYSQNQIKNAIIHKLWQCVEDMSGKEDVSDEGLTVYVAECSINGKKFDMTISLTPLGAFDDFAKRQMEG